MTRIPLRTRFEAKFVRGAPDECWPWQGSTNGAGYGTIAPPGGLGVRAAPGAQPLLAHRVSYELHVGPIPEGMEIDHVRERGCTSRACVNPAHLEAVTGPENTRRGGLARRALTPEQVADLRRRKADGALLRELAADVGLSVSRVSALILEPTP